MISKLIKYKIMNEKLLHNITLEDEIYDPFASPPSIFKAQ